MSLDLSDKHKANELGGDPARGATPMALDVPRIRTVAELLRESQARAHSRAAALMCTTGHYQVDNATGGLKPGFVWVIGADTNWGKSSLLIMIADENIKKKKRVLIVSAEDDESLYGNRLLVRRSRVSADNFRQKKLLEEELLAIDEVARSGEDEPCFFDARGRSAEWVAARTKELIKEYSIDLVAFDYLQAFDSDKRHPDRRNQVSYIARALTDAVKLSNVAGIIFSQITVQEGKAHPDKHSIRESRDVSNAAEVVALGFTPDKPVVRKSDGLMLAEAGDRCILLDKVKDGPKGGLFPIKWDDRSACFDVKLEPQAARYQEIVGQQFDDFGDDPHPGV